MHIDNGDVLDEREGRGEAGGKQAWGGGGRCSIYMAMHSNKRHLTPAAVTTHPAVACVVVFVSSRTDERSTVHLTSLLGQFLDHTSDYYQYPPILLLLAGHDQKPLAHVCGVLWTRKQCIYNTGVDTFNGAVAMPTN